jgi:hypothetical protein
MLPAKKTVFSLLLKAMLFGGLMIVMLRPLVGAYLCLYTQFSELLQPIIGIFIF